MKRQTAILQSEAAECGLASITSIAWHHGLEISLRDLRKRYPASLRGTSLSQLIAIGDNLGFRCRALRLELEELDQLAMPCILHWDLNHFVVLTRVRGKMITIMDPAFGWRQMSHTTASQHFTGVALEMTPGQSLGVEQHLSPPVRLAQLTGRVRGIWTSLATILALSFALQIFVAVAPFFLQWVVDQVLVTMDQDLLSLLTLGFAGLLLIEAATGALRSWCITFLSTRLKLQWGVNIFAHLLRLPLNFFEKRHIGDLISRMSSSQVIQRTLTTGFVEAVVDGLMATITLAVMLIYSWKLAVLSLLAVGLYVGLRALAFAPMRSGTEKQLVADAQQQSYLLESVRGIQSIKVAGRESLRNSGYANLFNTTVNREIGLAKLGIGFSSASQLVFGLERILVIWLAARLAMEKVFSVGMLIAYLAYREQFALRVASMINKWIEFRMLGLHSERLADIALTAPEDDQPPLSQSQPTRMRLEVRDLHFRYSDGESWILQGCSFTIEEGESIAIVGPSGCGKTTLLKLMLGLLKPTSGTVMIDGQDIASVGIDSYRSLVGAVMQDDQLFAGSVAENISFGDGALDLHRIEAAARFASVHEEIASMTMGYFSLIGDMGAALSGGQKQRVILARALYREPRILFLDEATSHLDIGNERIVNQAVRKLRLTKIIVAHRPETIASADRVLEMEDGRIKARPLQPTCTMPESSIAQ